MEISNLNTTSIMNGQVGNPMMYGTNGFIDILFKNIMENGLQGVSIIFVIFQAYMYLSLEKIKELIKMANEKLCDKMTIYGGIIYEKGSIICEKYWNKYYSKLSVVVQNIFMIYIYAKFALVFGLIFSMIYKNNQNNQLEETEKQDMIENTESKYTYTVEINKENKPDMMALANFLLQNRTKISDLQLDRCKRVETNKYKSKQTYLLPNRLKIIYDGYDIIINQNVNYTIVCEVANKNISLIDTIYNTDENYVKILYKDIVHKFAKKIRNKYDNMEITFKMMGHSILPRHHCGTLSNNIDPFGFDGGNSYQILAYIYYTKNWELFLSYYNMCTGKKNHEFCFDGKIYVSTNGNGLEEINEKNSEEIMKEFYEYSEIFIKYMNDINDPPAMKFFKEGEHLFKYTSKESYGISIELSSDTLNINDLWSKSEDFMDGIINDYYNISSTKNNVEISVYQLNIDYRIEKVKKENPKYIEWILNYEKEEKEEKEEKKDDDKKKEETSDSKEPNNKKISKTENIYDRDYDEYMPFGRAFRYRDRYDYIPPKPVQFIEEEIKTSFVDSVLIKNDQKPFEYLYLQKIVKYTLADYLNNFKNNKSKYKKMGIPYKGGIILHGEPGCGKSSTIMAVATYLQKNIYYANLAKVTTNKEFKLLIDYVNTTSQNGGIIIFEDIDCATDIVLRRDSIVVKKDAGHSLNDKLDLSFMLNMLDGTMSPEDIIFMMTTNHPEKLDPAITRPGRMDINIELKKCDKYQFENIFNDIYERRIDKELVKRFIEYKFSTADVILHLFHSSYNREHSDEEIVARFLEQKE